MLQRLIVPGAKPVISSPMHSFWLRWERICNAEVGTAQPLPHLLRFKDQAVTDTNLPRRIAQVIAVPTSPGVAARRKQLQHLAPAFAYEKRSRSAEVPTYPDDGKSLTIKGDRSVVPVPQLNSLAKELVSSGQPVA